MRVLQGKKSLPAAHIPGTPGREHDVHRNTLSALKESLMNLIQTLARRSTSLVIAGVLAAALGAVAIPAKADDGLDDVAAFMDGGMRGAAGGHGMRVGHGGHGGHGMHGRMIERMLDLVNASADQRSRIKSILETAHKDLKTQREAARPLHEQMRSVFTQPNIDARAAETLRAQMSAQRDAASKRMLQARLEVANVLTPEQRKLVAERLAQRRAMMERHRSERQSLERR